MDIDATALRSNEPDIVAQGFLAIALLGLVGSWLQRPAPQAVAPERPVPNGDTFMKRVTQAVDARGNKPFTVSDLHYQTGLHHDAIRWVIRKLRESGTLEAIGATSDRKYRRVDVASAPPVPADPVPAEEDDLKPEISPRTIKINPSRTAAAIDIWNAVRAMEPGTWWSLRDLAGAAGRPYAVTQATVKKLLGAKAIVARSHGKGRRFCWVAAPASEAPAAVVDITVEAAPADEVSRHAVPAEPWSEDEDEILRRDYPRLTPYRLSKIMPRSRAAIQWRLEALGLLVDDLRPGTGVLPAPKEEFAADLFKDVDTHTLAAELNVIGRHQPTKPVVGAIGSQLGPWR